MNGQNNRRPDAEFYMDWAIHEDNVFTNRANFFLVAEAMLLAGVASLLSEDMTALRSRVSIILCCAGVFSTWLWIYVSTVQIDFTLNKVKEKLRECEDRYNEIDEYRKKYRPTSTHKVVGIFLPKGLLVVWVLLLFSLVSVFV